MNVTFTEKPDSPTSTENPEQITRKWTLNGIFDYLVARAFVYAATPTLYCNLWRKDIKLAARGFKLWDVEVPYVTSERRMPEPGEFKWAYDTTGGTAKITQARENIANYKATGVTVDIPDHKGAIGVTSDGTVEGCEIVVPAVKWVETWQLSILAATFEYGSIVEALTGMVNDATFRGKEAGTVRFDGAQLSGSNKSVEIVEGVFHFAFSRNITNLTAGAITGISKGGHQYLWFEFETTQPGGAGKPTATKAKFAHVERVYDAGDFSLLNIGTGIPPAVPEP